MKLYLIRHGETDWNKEFKIQGSSDIELNEYGRELAFITREGLRHIPFDIAYTSPLKRAKETAEIILGGRNIPLYEERQLEDFSKYVFGMSYQTLKDVMKQQKGREEQCRKQGCWWKRKEQLAKKQYHTGLNCR